MMPLVAGTLVGSKLAGKLARPVDQNPSEEERAKVMVRGGKMDFFRTLRTCWRTRPASHIMTGESLYDDDPGGPRAGAAV